MYYVLPYAGRPLATQDIAPQKRGISSAGRAPALQAGSQRFDPAILHHITRKEVKLHEL